MVQIHTLFIHNFQISMEKKTKFIYLRCKLVLKNYFTDYTFLKWFQS